MQLTTKQEEGLRIALARYRSHEKYTVISGYAGSGKSTLVRFILSALEDLGIDREVDVACCAFTGKASQVLSRKGNPNCMTLHKLLFESFPKPDGTFSRKRKWSLGFKVVVVDECSMAPKDLVDILLSHNVYVIFCGDPAQLPPISKNDNNHLLDSPHVFLDEIMRQAQDSGIIRLSMAIRNGDSLKPVDEPDVKVMRLKDYDPTMLFWADQVICAKNDTIQDISKVMRDSLGKTGALPEDGDKVICGRNYWDDHDDRGNALVNGTIGYLKDPYQTTHYIPAWAGGGKIAVTKAKFISDIGSDFATLDIDTKMIQTGEKCVDSSLAFKLGRNFKTQYLVPKEFKFGYAITGHRAQGSQWDKVLVIEERFPWPKEEHKQWLYTSVTRASSRLILITKE